MTNVHTFSQVDEGWRRASLELATLEPPEAPEDTTFTFHDENGVLRFERDDAARVVREYDADGELIGEREFTPEEHAAADEAAARNTREGVEQALRDGLRDVIDAALDRQAKVQEIIDTPNSEVNNRPAPFIMTLARASKRQERAIIRLARLTGGLLDSADTGED